MIRITPSDAKGAIVFLFTIAENVPEALAGNFIGHEDEKVVLPKNGDIFFLANSLTRTIMGPFRRTRHFRTNGSAVCYRGTPEPHEVECFAIMKFATLKPEGYRFGVSWDVVADKAGIDPGRWGLLKRTELTLDQIQAVCDLLLAANEPGANFPGMVPLPRLRFEEMRVENQQAVSGTNNDVEEIYDTPEEADAAFRAECDAEDAADWGGDDSILAMMFPDGSWETNGPGH